MTLANFHGIEINDFACCVARTALWIAEKQADLATAKVVQRVYDELPLKEYDTVLRGNALRIDWNDVVPAEKCDYVMGNPPFIGYSNLASEQKVDREAVLGKGSGFLDYVACWYRKTADYMGNHPARAALVSTNSICQGQQVDLLWKPLFKDGIHIDFAHQTFVWNSEAADEAHVHVIIVGFSRQQVQPKLLFDSAGRHEASHINAYLSDAPDAFISKRKKPLSSVSEMSAGFKPAEHGNLLLDSKEYEQLIAKDPSAACWIRPFSMGAEFINGIPRYCLWLEGITDSDLKEHPFIRNRVEACRSWRSEQVKTGDAYRYRDRPHLFKVCNYFVDGPYIAVPKVSSGRRKYIPMGFVTNGMIPGDKLFFIPGGTLYEFGILMSQFHNAWMRVVAGRLKSDYSYANTIVYNNFVWPESTDAQRAEVERCAQAVLNARDLYKGSTLADMYDPDNDFLYPELMKAHEALDAAVEAAYGVDFDGNEEKIVAHLFKLYAEKAGE